MKVVDFKKTLAGEVFEDGPLQWIWLLRLFGCNLNCCGCDTPQAKEGSGYCDADTEEIGDEFLDSAMAKMLITGGEPLLQVRQLRDLINYIDDEDNRYFTYCLETNGSLFIPDDILRRCKIIMDVKTPSSGHKSFNQIGNMERLDGEDYVKFVIEDYEDYTWAKEYLGKHYTPAKIAVSPKWGVLDPKELIKWIREDQAWRFRLNLQLHKYIWGEDGDATNPTE
jgi:7-carboxy-7-deazaguanine synthase